MSHALDHFFFQIYPYITFTVFVVGSFLRILKDPYSWRTKSSQLFGRRSLILGSILLHIGILIIAAGHIVGLLTPFWILESIGIKAGQKQFAAIILGGIAGISCFVGLLILLFRRLINDKVRAHTSFADFMVLIILLVQVSLGLITIPFSYQHLDGGEMLKFMSWAQAVVTGQEIASSYIGEAPIVFKLHIILGLTLFLVFPFTRLVHVLSAPIFYVLRPFQIVRR